MVYVVQYHLQGQNKVSWHTITLFCLGAYAEIFSSMNDEQLSSLSDKQF